MSTLAFHMIVLTLFLYASDQQNKVGHLSCKVCDVSWQCPITYLDEAVDVYSAWIDACENVNKDRGSSRRTRDTEEDDQEEEYESRQRPAANFDEEDD
jgi:transcription elongation factor Elf1